MKFANLMYEGHLIKVIIDLEDYFIENEDVESEEDYDTLDLTTRTNDNIIIPAIFL